jgi:phage terminase large subunit
MYLIDLAQNNKDLTISVVSESLPHLKKGAMKDFFSIMKSHNYYNEGKHNKTDNIYNFDSGSMIEFFGIEDANKARGPRRDVLFINECNNVPFMVFDQMEVRTKIEIILDYNPTNEFWVNTEVMPYHNYDFLKLTYKDNEALSPEIVASIERRKHNTNWWRVFGEGEMGINEGQVYTDWIPLDAIPEEAELVRRGLDFGYTNDPTTVVDVYRWNNAYILDERLYRTGMSNKEIAEFLKSLNEPRTIVVADSAEPKSIDEIKRYGIRVTPATKGADSVKFGMQIVQDQKIYYTNTSLNLIKEQRNHLWKMDKLTGKATNIPEDIFNHALDAIRYALTDIIGLSAAQKYNPNRIG